MFGLGEIAAAVVSDAESERFPQLLRMPADTREKTADRNLRRLTVTKISWDLRGASETVV